MITLNEKIVAEIKEKFFNKNGKPSAKLVNTINELDSLINSADNPRFYIYNKYGNGRNTTYTIKPEYDVLCVLCGIMFNRANDVTLYTFNDSPSGKAKYGVYVNLKYFGKLIIAIKSIIGDN